MLETAHCSGYVFVNFADEKIIAAPFAERKIGG
jgi:hypothetical protein